MLNTKGTADYLGCSPTWIRKLATSKDERIKQHIRAYVYLDGVLTEHDRNNPHPGQELFFKEEDLDAYQSQLRGPGRRRGSKDKEGGKSREKEKNPDIAEVLDSLHSAMATWAGSWSEDHRLAWIYGIIVGWNEGEEDIFEKYKWDEENRERFKKYRQVMAKLEKSYDSH